MNLETAVRTMELLIAFALILQSIEHLLVKLDSSLRQFIKIILCVLLIAGIGSPFVVPALFVIGVYQIKICQGPYNGGSDRMALLVLLCLSVAQWAPTKVVRDFAISYLALQVILSYFMAGMAKARNVHWFSGHMLQEIFLRSNYVTGSWRAFGHRQGLLKKMAVAIVAFEALFPLALFSSNMLYAMLALAVFFHIGNGVVLGLNRFIWTWLAAYPALVWFEGRFGG